MAAAALALGQSSRARSVAVLSPWITALVILAGMFMAVLDQTVVNVALPTVIATFNASIHTSQLVITVYTLSSAIMTPTTGYLADTYGAKRLWLTALTVFITFSFMCSFSWNVEVLAIFRVLQGIGGGLLMPTGQAMLFKAIPPEQRGRTQGVLGLAILAAPALGPTVGGYLVTNLSWRAVFLINIPVGIVAIFLASTLLEEQATIPGLRADFAGFVAAGVAFGCALYAFTNGPTDGWTAPHIEVLLGVSGIFFLAWIVIELTAADPLLDLRLFKDWFFSLGTFVVFVIVLALFGAEFLLPLLLQSLRGLSAFDAGLLLLGQGLAAAVASLIGGFLFNKVGARWLLIVGFTANAIATFLLAKIDVTTPDSTTQLILVIRGLAFGLSFMPINLALMNRIPREQLNRATALLTSVRLIFASFGVAVMATVVTTRTTFHQAVLSDGVTSTSVAANRFIAAASGQLIQHGWTAPHARELALSLLNGMLQQRASVLSFDDAFLIMSVLSVAAIVPAFFLNARRGSAEGAPEQGALMH
ncbi:MAG: DHA2 family efflux MFS transporter permease subunit [Chloroflexota bacterium]|nr:DHA2 family efflux MFS transporter permease subunit [Chloroflexota bacterium]